MEWSKDKRERFIRRLTEYGWRLLKIKGDTETYQKAGVRLDVDAHGIFVIYHGVNGNWKRLGLCDSLVDQYLPDPTNFLFFENGSRKRIRHFNLVTAEFFKKPKNNEVLI